MIGSKALGTPRWLAQTDPISPVDPLAASTSLEGPAIFFERPLEGEATAGFGVAAEYSVHQGEFIWTVIDRLTETGQIEWLGEQEVRPPGPWFGGLAFDPSQNGVAAWPGFPASRWILPRWLVWTRNERSYLTAFAPLAEGATIAQRSLEECLDDARRRLPRENAQPSPERIELQVTADRRSWNPLVERALKAIAAGALDKVVLARKIVVTGSSPFDCGQILARLREAVPGCTLFLIRPNRSEAFLGATPETLCRVRGDWLETEAIGGSAPTPGQPALTSSDKEAREHRAVVEGISEALQPLCFELDVDAAPGVLGLPHLFHLKTAIRCRLQPKVRLAEVVSALHPTAAVGGTPRVPALEFLASHENLARGWYAGAVGWMGEDGAELSVAIRSALLQGRVARLFVGAGIVAGSTPDAEWNETETKSLTLLEAIRGGNVAR
jgi:isochorismate synthase